MEYTHPGHPSYSTLLFGAPGSLPVSETPSVASSAFDSTRNSPYAFTDARLAHPAGPAAGLALSASTSHPVSAHGFSPLHASGLLPSYYPDALPVGGLSNSALSSPAQREYLAIGGGRRAYGQDDGVPQGFPAGANDSVGASASTDAFAQVGGIGGLYSRSTPAGPSRHPVPQTALGPDLAEGLYPSSGMDTSSPIGSAGTSSLALGTPAGTRPWVPQERGPWQEPTPDYRDFTALPASDADSIHGGRGANASSDSRGSTSYGQEDGRMKQTARRQTMAGLSALTSVTDQSAHAQSVPRSLSLSAGAGSNSHMSAATDYPKSSVYPENLYDEVLPEGTSWEGGRQISGADCGQALAAYEHILSAVPHLRSVRPGIDDDRDATPHSSLRPLYELASEGAALLSGAHNEQMYELDDFAHGVYPANGSPAGLHLQGMDDNGHPRQSSAGQGTKRGGRDKSQTKCLGCGATETPEWRRGPMGPRTLCNACGLVHMKLQRKRKKQEEKANAAGEEAGHTKARKVKNGEAGG